MEQLTQLTHLLGHPEVRVTRAPRDLLPPGADASVPLVGYLVLAPAAPAVPERAAAADGEAEKAEEAGEAGEAAVLAEFAPRSGNGLGIDVERRLVTVDGAAVPLTYLEFELLAYLVRHPHRVFTRGHLVSRVWGYLPVGDERTVDVHVARLRRKLGGRYRARIVTVRRVGYKYTPGTRCRTP